MNSPENQHMKSDKMKNALNQQTLDPNESGISSASPMSPPEQNMNGCMKNDPNHNKSGYCSVEDATPMSSGVANYKDEGGLSLTMKRKLEYSDDVSPLKKRPTQRKRILNVSYNNRKHKWETNGNESIPDWVQRNLSEGDSKPKAVPNMDKLIFRTSDDRLINLGCNTSILNEEEMYKCEFRQKMVHKMKSELSRMDFPDLIDFSNVKSFNVKNKGFSVNHLHKIQGIESLQVNFLPEESLYEALYRDGRFVKDKLRDYDLEIPKENDKRVNLSASAGNFAEHDLKFVKRRNANKNLPSKMQSYKNRHCGNPVETKSGSSSNNEVEIVQEPEASIEEQHRDSPVSRISVITSDKELLDFIGVLLKVDTDLKNGKKAIKRVDKLFETKYNHFAMKMKHHQYTADHEFLAKLCHSVGALVVQYESGEKAFKGTCFRIGTQFVITNHHVVEEILKEANILKHVLVDFDHGEPDPSTHKVFLCGPYPVVSSVKEALDYAVLILGVQDEQELPPSLTPDMLSLPGFCKHLEEGRFLHFAGHPGNDKTATNLSCPVQSSDTLAKEYAITLSLQDEMCLNEANRESYHVSTLFHGSSGSPGFLLREKMLMVLHTRRVCLDPSSGKTVEQGVMMTAIVADVHYKIRCGLLSYQFKELFGMEIPQ